MDASPPRKTLAQQLPDIPRWVEARASLLWQRADLFGLQRAPELAAVLRDRATKLVVVVGAPEHRAIQTAAAITPYESQVIAPYEQASEIHQALPGWRGSKALLHTLTHPEKLPDVSQVEVGFLEPHMLPSLELPGRLRRELELGAQHSRIAASFVGHRPVAFCYAGAITESWWDVSIDTLTGFRRRGYAARCASYMIRFMHSQGQQPVWGAVVENPASWRLAQKLGFEVIDTLALFDPPEKRGEGS